MAEKIGDGRSMDSSSIFFDGLNESLKKAAIAEDRAEVAEIVASKAQEIAQLVTDEKERREVFEAIGQMAVRIQSGNGLQQEATSREEDSD